MANLQWIYPFAGAIDTELPKPARTVHMMLKHKAAWVEPQVQALLQTHRWITCTVPGGRGSVRPLVQSLAF